MTREEAIEHIEMLFDQKVKVLSAEAMRIAIDSIRAQRTPAKLDRSRWEGCEYCKGDPDGYTSVVKEWHGSGDMYIPEGKPQLVVSKKYSDVARIHINFCPFCGRPLTKEAWAELERKIGGNDEKADN